MVLARAPGYIGSAFHKGIEDPRSFVLRVQWETVEAHTSFRQTPEFQDWRRPFFQHVDGPPMAGHYEVFTPED
jgi:heme-degrading monooxygenase HmoA